MNAELSHDEVAELLGAFALDAVDADEADAIERHLRECPRCRAEVARHREVAALLGNAGGPAPAGLWERISASLEEAPPDLELAPVVEIAASRRVRSWTGGLAAAAAAVLIVGLGVEVGRLDRRVSQLQRPLKSAGVLQEALAADVDPSAHRIALRSDTSADSAQVVVLPDGRAYILQAALPPLPGTKTYQLWGLRGAGGTTAISLGLLGAQPGTSAFRVDPAHTTALAITVEPAGGVTSPDQAPLVTGAF
jgi:anti-sigma-K factor RskA